MRGAGVVRLALLVKVITVGLLVFAVAHRDWDRFAGKAVPGRLIGYPFALALVPVLWVVLRRRGPLAYPGVADLLVALPFAVDVVGNAANAYDSISWFDDAAHFVNWALLFGALAISLPRRLPALVQLGLVVGLGSLVALVWELVEYVTFIHDSAERATAYTDTLGDMALGTSGALVSGLAVVLTRTRRRTD
jgi:hypothetical protein